MFVGSPPIRRLVGHGYAFCHAALISHLLRGHSGSRDFSRVVVVAALGRNTGIAIGARLQYAALRQLGIDAELVDATPALRSPWFRARHRPGTAYVFHAGAPQTGSLIGAVLPQAATAWRVGYWAWELPDPPQSWIGCDSHIDEIWTPSSFSRQSLVQCFNKPVHVAPHHMLAHPIMPRPQDRPFTVLTMADSRSSLSRKNPEGAVRAFHSAFGSSTSAQLLLKLAGNSEETRRFEASVGDLLRSCNVRVIRDHLDDAGLSALYQQSDALLSLHRAEGYGLPMREAMSYGLPVVATGWSGNMDFMTQADACLVPYRLVPVNDAAGIYRDSTWAEPDIEAAAEALRRLAMDPDYRAQVGALAHRAVASSAPILPLAPQGQSSVRDDEVVS